LFDAVACLVGLRQVVNYEGQAAMELEFRLQGVTADETYPFTVDQTSSDAPVILDWRPMLPELLLDVAAGVPVGCISARFHNTLVEMMVAVAKRAGVECIALSGGCFQNAYLTERAVQRLREEGFRPYWHQRVPPNDGGIALGQIVAASVLG
jgi:hydrogenase maturation protein HypF